MLGILVVAVAVTPRAAFGQASQEHADGLLPPGDWSEEQQMTLLDLIDRTEAELPAFADPEELVQMGFKDFGAVAPGGYVHYINWDWFDDPYILDPSHPESVVFQQVWNDETQEVELNLVSAMFFLPNQYDLTNIPEDLIWMPGWHTHANVCVNDQGTFAGFPDSDGHCDSGHPFSKPPMMHVWIVDNECGHRFGGVDITGLHCDVHGHPGHGGGGMPPSTAPPSTAPPQSQTPPPAPAVRVPPTFTG